MGKKYGLKNWLLVWPPYQKNIHTKQKVSNSEKKKYSNEVIFIGTWFPERGIFFKKIISLGLNIRIFGTRWNKDPNYYIMKNNITLGHVRNKKYAKLIQGSKISICIPSKGNFDGITKRSTEIPAIGSMLCATRTYEHKKLYLENKEAIFFKDVYECYNKCKTYLKNKDKIKKITVNGNKKVTKILKIDFESTIKKILKIVK